MYITLIMLWFDAVFLFSWFLYAHLDINMFGVLYSTAFSVSFDIFVTLALLLAFPLLLHCFSNIAFLLDCFFLPKFSTLILILRQVRLS